MTALVVSKTQPRHKKNHKQVICINLKWIKIDEIKSKLVVVCRYEWVDTLSASVEGSNKGFKENGRQEVQIIDCISQA